jgi:hypothetical protein
MERLGVLAGLHDLSTRRVVTDDIAQWQEEIAWMSLSFGVAMWWSLALCAALRLRSRAGPVAPIPHGLGKFEPGPPPALGPLRAG